MEEYGLFQGEWDLPSDMRDDNDSWTLAPHIRIEDGEEWSKAIMKRLG